MKDRIRMIREKTQWILSQDATVDDLKIYQSFTEYPEAIADLDHLKNLARADGVTSIIETFKFVDEISRKAYEDIPESKADVRLKIKAIAILHARKQAVMLTRNFLFNPKDESGEGWELLRRRNEIPKGNYFRTLFLHEAFNHFVYTRFVEPCIEQAKNEGRLPAKELTDADEKAYDAFYKSLEADEPRHFKAIAEEYGEGDLPFDFQQYEETFPADLRRAVDALAKEEGELIRAKRKADREADREQE